MFAEGFRMPRNRGVGGRYAIRLIRHVQLIALPFENLRIAYCYCVLLLRGFLRNCVLQVAS